VLILLPSAFGTNPAFSADPPTPAQLLSNGERKRDALPRGGQTPRQDEDHRSPTVVECVQPLLGAGYLPYSFPGFDTCPCGADGCFHPARYHCDCGAYKKHWLRTWLRTHFCNGSMLEQYPCHCVHPQFGRGYLVSITPAIEEPAQIGEESDHEDKEQDQEAEPQDEPEPSSGEMGRGFRLAPPSPLSQLPACRPVLQQVGFQSHR
jgi:hypothetical protein